MRRVAVVGNAGSGKSVLARSLAERLGVPWVELDSLYHQPGWQPRPVEDFRGEVERLTSAGGWVVDGNYSAVRDMVWGRADTVVWLDLPRRTVMRQVIWRTVRRAALRVELWNGNRERWSNLVSRNAQDSIIAWAWWKHGAYRDRYTLAAADPANAHLRFVRVRSRAEARRLVERAPGVR